MARQGNVAVGAASHVSRPPRAAAGRPRVAVERARTVPERGSFWVRMFSAIAWNG